MRTMSFAFCLSATLFVMRAVPSVAQADFQFGNHAIDQCSEPIRVATNVAGNNAQNTLLHRDAEGVCRSQRGYCIGDCVTVVVARADGALSRGVNVVVGSDLPNPGTCSDIAELTNDPVGWDFTSTGSCGKGKSGAGLWHNCFVHDTCVWARCTDDNLIAGGLRASGQGGIEDTFCGRSFDHARLDWAFANAVPTCLADAQCPAGTDCIMGLCRQIGLNEGSGCVTDADCAGYCELLKCWDGSLGDRCGKNADCAAELTCSGVPGLKTCKRGLPEGKGCTLDSDCAGYCQRLKCWDGSTGDRCGSGSDCQSGKCERRCAICAQKRCK